MPAFRTQSNLTGLDYRAEAARLGPPPVPIIDVHAHVAGGRAARVYDEARRMFGVRRVYSMTTLPQAPAVRDALGGDVSFIAFPNWAEADKGRAHRQGFLDAIETFRRDYGSRIIKLWSSPRLRDIVPDAGVDLAALDSPWRRRACEIATRLGMAIMVHIADPDIWFATNYKDAAKYGTKRSQYEPLERMADEFEGPWIIAHMGGWPEDLRFLSGLLSRHPNLVLDTSATKWVVRELGRQEPGVVRAFFTRWRGRLLFGSDIVTTDDHLSPRKDRPDHPKATQAASEREAFDLYASRYWALRTMFETAFDAPSPIADPDLKLADPSRYDDWSSPRLRGLSLPRADLESLYSGAVASVLKT
ncbi:MAG: amidohydrolase family protein [Phycisphaerales bacterium]|nr:amidohydrolase family protein [Phycisphaerales bacterium]